MMRFSQVWGMPIDVSQISKSAKVLKPTSEWKKCFDKVNKKTGSPSRRAFWHDFLEISPSAAPLLGLPPTGLTIPPAGQVFQNLQIDPKKLLRDPDPRTHVNLAATVKAMGYLVEMPDGSGHTSIYEKNERLIKIMPRALMGTTKPNIDSFAGLFLQLTGFADGNLQLLTQQQEAFCMFGRRCESKPEHFVIVTPNNDLVLIVEDGTHKSAANQHLFRNKQSKFEQYHGYVGQVLGEMLMAASLNARLPVPYASDGSKLNVVPSNAAKRKSFRAVFALRFAGLHLTGFRLNFSKNQMQSLATGQIPKKKLEMLTTVKNCAEDPGWDLTDPGDRGAALRMCAALLRKVS